MKLLISSASVILGLIGKSLAHTIFQQVWVNGVDQGFEYAMRLPSYDGPQTDVTTTYMNCNGPPNDLLYNSTGVITASAGATMTGRWGQYLETNSPSVDPSHKGPIMVYMAPAGGSVGTIAPPHGGWFKIYEDGLHSDGTWAVDKMIANNGLWTWTIPSCIPSGQYFVRGEMIALHAASSYPGAQLYFECAQVSIINGGSATPSTVSFPGAYHTNDPGILYNLYAGSTTYTIPGPTVFACPGSGGTTKAPTTTPTTTPIKTTTPSTTTTTKTTTTGGSSGSCAALYGQCGGIGYTGGTCCSSGTCTVSNAYYSQCLP